MFRRQSIGVALALTIVIAGRATGQAGGSCPANSQLSYGWISMECIHCTVHHLGTGQWVEYAAEPVVGAVAPGVSGENNLLRGDVLIAIDGFPVTTASGALQLAAPIAGRPVRFDLRRAGRLLSVTIVPRCLKPVDVDVLRELVRLRDAAILRADTTIRPPPASGGARGISSGTWLGFAFASVAMTSDATGTGVVHAEFPTVSRINDPGPAALAGLRPGDILRAVDGLLLTTVEGTKRLGSIKRGEKVILRVERDGKVIELTLLAGSRGGSQ